ncbi:MAG TPA: extracellular solute-binding protein [Chloroflexota bacterium]|nr:extracellular solute-binding protein [Chloroflexota bacterium]
MTTRRRVITSGGVAGAALTLAACGGQAQDTGAAAPAGQLKVGSTLIFWNGQGGSYPALMTQWGERFQQKTGVKVEATGGIASFDEKMTGSFAAGSPPDVWRYSPGTFPLPLAIERNMLLKIEPYVKRDKYDLNDFRKDSIDLYRWKGALHALPRDYGLQLIYYNTDIFQKEGLPPIPADWNDKTWTFQKFLDACTRVTKGDRYALYVPRGDRLWASFVYSNGGAVVKKNGEGIATEIALTEKPATEALQLMQDLIYKHKVAPLPSEEAGLGTPQSLLQNGRLAMWITNPSSNSNFKTVQGLPYDVGVFPLGAGQRRGVGGGGTAWGASGPTKLPEEAWQFMAFISSKEAELDEVKIGQTTPSRISVGTGSEYLAPPPKSARAFADGQEYVVRDPMHSKWTDINRDVVGKLMDDLLWTGKATASQVTKEIKEKADPLLKS